ncbi:MAG: hypothetical protein WC979_03330 [Candidatus Pacearchaeota archaeon]|jgi:hypothetical protein|nr:hypothetical protein [Clostridia bacterium]
MKVTTITCDCCGAKIEGKSYYETMVQLKISAKTNSDSEPEQQRNNYAIDYELCPKCYSNYWNEIRFVLGNMRKHKECLDNIVNVIATYKEKK